MAERLLLRELEGSPGSSPGDSEKPQAERDEGLVCRQCGYAITKQSQSTEVRGSHSHTFFNPAGIVFEIGCFQNAPGIWVHGPSSSDFSWFSGYRWQIALCNGCTTHLGWYFSSVDGAFFGLILKKLLSSG